MFYFILLLCATVFADDPSSCTDIAGEYQLANGRGHFTSSAVTIQPSDACTFTVTVPDLGIDDSVIVSGNSLLVTSGDYTGATGEVDERGLILWNNGYYYWPSHLPQQELPLDCLHPFSLHCYETCADCSRCADDHTLPGCDECQHCEQCVDYIPCLEAVEDKPECLQPEAFTCLRECRQCTTCDEFSDCQGLISTFDEHCVSVKAVECLDQCEQCIPCANGEDGADCSGCEECDRCTGFIDCAEQVHQVPEEQRHCLNEEAIHCLHDCGHCSECSEHMDCLDAFPSPNMCEKDAFMNLLESMSPELQESCHHAMGEADEPAQDCPCFNHLLDEVSQILDIDCFWDEGSPETLRQEAERMCRSAAPPTPPEDFGYEIEVSNYPCATHGSEPDSVNQVYQMVRMGGNQQRIFRGTKDDRWWIYFDENCGGDHEPSWFLTPEAPDFEAKENLQNSDHGCTNTLKFSEIHFPSSVSISHFFCDANPEDLENEPRPSGWNNEFTQNGWEVHVDFRGAAPQPNCVDDDNYFQLMMTLMESDELSSCSDLINDDLRAEWCPQTDGACGCQCRDYPVTQCMEFREGNYQVNDASTGEIVAHFKMWKDGCHGGMSMESSTDRMEMSLSFFMNRVETIDPEGTLFVGTPTANGLIFNDMYDFHFIDCMIIYTGNYELKTQEQEHAGHHFMHQDGCQAVSMYRDESKPDEERRSTFTLTHETLSGDVSGEHIEGERGADGEIHWSNGYVSYPLVEESHHCHEDGHRFYDYVRNIVPEHQHHRVSDLLQKVEWEGCNVLRMDFEMKENFCLFHPEVRDACSCICDDDSEPGRHVCSPEQFESWMTRDLGHECQMLFISGLAEEHRPACDCMRSIPHDAAEELFGSDCYFSPWSDRSFYRMWEDCQHHY